MTDKHTEEIIIRENKSLQGMEVPKIDIKNLIYVVRGQIYDAFSLLVELVSKAEKKLILIDNYVDVSTLNILAKKKINVQAIIFTVKKTKLSETDVNNFNQQYPTLEVKYTGVFHDRFLIVDNILAYHIGASIKDAGRKCFGISLIEDDRIVKDILKRLYLESESFDQPPNII